MPSDVIIYPNGGGRIIHRLRRPSRGPCAFCLSPHVFLCDFRLPNGQTCDKKLCAVCTTRVGASDFCPIHAKKS